MKHKQCTTCGSQDFQIIDGQLICTVCSTQQEHFNELEAEDAILGITKIRIKKTQDGVGVRETAPREIKKASRKVDVLWSRSKFGQSETRVTAETQRTPWENTPQYLNRVGTRLATFVDILARAAESLVNRGAFPTCYMSYVHKNMKEYLCHCGVAYTHEEVAIEEEDRFVAIVTNFDWKRERKQEDRVKAQRRKTRGIEKLGTSMAAWQLLSMGNLTQNLEMDSSDESDKEEEKNVWKMMKEEKHELPDSQKQKAESVELFQKVVTNLSIEALQRARKVMLDMDLIVNILYISAQQAGARDLLLSDFVRWFREDRFRITVREMRFLQFGDFEIKAIHGSRDTMFMRLPLAEFYRINYLTQKSLQLTSGTNVLKIVARMATHLNLPAEVVRKVYALHQLMPVTTLPSRYTDLSTGFTLRKFTESNSEKLLSRYQQLALCFGKVNGTVDSFDEEAFISPEAKALGLILVAMKLLLPLDDSVVEVDRGIFNVDMWIRQLDYRLRCWRGYDMAKVLGEDELLTAVATKMPLNYHEYPSVDSKERKSIKTRHRRKGFMNSIPAVMSLRSSHNVPNAFSNEKGPTWDDSSLYSPLEHQCRRVKDAMNEDPMRFKNVSEQAKTVFFHEFLLDQMEPSGSYSKYPRPEWARNCTVRSITQEEHSAFDKNTDFPKLNGRRQLYIPISMTKDLYETAHPAFSAQFDFLLRSFAMIYGEDVVDVYTAMILAEIQLIDRDK